MTKRFESGFLFAVTNPGSEKALKREVEMAGLAWRPGYQRKGFVTFKAEPGAPFDGDDLNVPLACARRICLSLGKFPSAEEAEAVVREKLGEDAPVHRGRFAERKMTGVSGRAAMAEEWVGTVMELGRMNSGRDCICTSRS